MTIMEIIIVFGLAGIGLCTVVYTAVKVVMKNVEANKKKKNRHGQVFVRHHSLVCVACRDPLYEVVERRKKEKMRAITNETVEREFGCFNHACQAGMEETRIFGSYLKALGPQHMRMRSEKPIRMVK